MALHILTLVLSVTLPMLLNHSPLLDNVVTVNLVTLPDAGQEAQQPEAPPVEQTAPPEPAPEPVPEPAPKLEPVKPKIQVPEPPPVVKEEPVAVKPVSLKPVKKKKKLVDEEKLVQEQVEQQRLKEVAKARLEEQNAQREAERARAALADMIKARGAKPSTSSAKGASARQGVQSIVSQQYLMTVGARMQQFWILPEMRQWDPKLEAVVVLTILRDGTVAKVTVEQQSADRYFDEFVMKTIESASPMPPFPKLMGENSIEVGFRFRPNEEVSW